VETEMQCRENKIDFDMGIKIRIIIAKFTAVSNFKREQNDLYIELSKATETW
jgi:hypothetical protein